MSDREDSYPQPPAWNLEDIGDRTSSISKGIARKGGKVVSESDGIALDSSQGVAAAAAARGREHAFSTHLQGARASWDAEVLEKIHKKGNCAKTIDSCKAIGSNGQ